MSNAFFRVPTPINEPVKGYAPGAPERIELVKELKRIKQVERDIPMHIGGKEVRAGRIAFHRLIDGGRDAKKGVGHRVGNCGTR